MGCHHTAERLYGAEKQMTVLVRVGGLDMRAVAMRTNFFQRVGNALSGSCELDGTGISQIFALPAHRRLDQLAEKRAAITDDQQTNAQGNQAPAVTGAAEHGTAHQTATNNAQNQNTVE